MGQGLCKCYNPKEKKETGVPPPVVPEVQGRELQDAVPEDFKVRILPIPPAAHYNG